MKDFLDNRSRGFTLIELLVVIAIIGILSAVVLASLNTARSKGSDAAIRGNLDSVRNEAEMDYNTNDGYVVTNITNGVCPTSVIPHTMWDDTIMKALQSAANLNGNSVQCYALKGLNGSYAITATLVTDKTKVYCIDSIGISTTTPIGTAGQNASGKYVCNKNVEL